MESKSEEYFVFYASDEDIFDEENNGENPRSKSPIDFKQIDADKAKLIRANKLLSGVPLPPKFTNPQVNLDTAVSLLKKYLAECSSVKNGSSIGTENTVLDMYPNRNIYTEKLENVRILIQDWFNSNETSSFMTCTARQLTESAKKKHKKNGWSESPASRAKYLNRRNTVYKALCSSNNSQRTLTLDRKNGLLKSKCDTKLKSKSIGPKRALFQSPDKQQSSSAPCFESNVPSTSSNSSSSTVCLKTPARSAARKWESKDEVKRSWLSCSGGRVSSEKKKCWRSLQFGNGQNNNENNHQSSSRSSQKLSTLHARKLLWAIDQVLKGEGLVRSDKEFRPLAKSLYKESSLIWLNKFEGQKRVGSTSNTMVEVAKSLFGPVAAQLGIQSKPHTFDRYESVFDVVANCHSSEDSSFNVSPEMVDPSLLEDSYNTNISETVTVRSNSSESANSKLTSEILGQGTQSDSDTTCDKIIEKNINSNAVYSIQDVCDDHSVITTPRSVSENEDISDRNLRVNKKTDIMSASERIDGNKCLEASDLANCRKIEKRKRGEETLKDQLNKDESIVKRLCLDEGGPSSDHINDNSIGGSNLTIEKDKENDSGVENTSELDTQNWSPIIKLRRTSRNNWTSELKKKCLNQNSDKSSSPPEGCSFLGIEGPFKYCLGERALEGDYVTVVLKEASYLNSYKKLIKRKEITEDSILVRPLEEGLELGIPVVLFEKEKVYLGPHTVCDLVGDILEDAIFRMDEMDCLKSSDGFPGFSMSEIYSSSVNSFRMTRSMKINEVTGRPFLKPLFTMYKYAIITKSPPDREQFYQIFVEIPKSSLFLMSRKINGETILVRSFKSNSPKKIVLELNVPVRLVSADHRPVNLSILEDFKNTNKILTLQTSI